MPYHKITQRVALAPEEVLPEEGGGVTATLAAACTAVAISRCMRSMLRYSLVGKKRVASMSTHGLVPTACCWARGKRVRVRHAWVVSRAGRDRRGGTGGAGRASS